MVLAHQKARRKYFERPKIIGLIIGAVALIAIGVYATESVTNAAFLKNADQTAAVQTAIHPFTGLNLIAHAAYVMDLKTRTILYERNPDAQLPLASLSKVSLAIVVSEVFSPHAAIKIPRDTAPKGSAERLAAGEIWQVKDILDFTLIASSNNGADILTEAADPLIHTVHAAAPREHATLWRMNDLARELKLNNTYFINTNGLDESTTQAGSYGSARDMATLFAYAASHWPQVFAGTTKNGLLLTSVHGDNTSAFNTNEALGSISGIIMGKTGFTDLAGGNLAIVFDVGPAHPVVAVILGSTVDGRFEDMKKIISATYASIALDN
ncbi:MAG: serine hydrolase [bacterium]|nr:serine hydrolase [bacterium]